MRCVIFSTRRMSIVFVALFSFLIACGGDQPKENEQQAQLSSAPPAQTRVVITKIDDQEIDPNNNPEVGIQAKVELTTTRPDVVVCVLVHPITADQWWVQNLPSLPDEVEESIWSWTTTIYCGTEQHGTREQYEVIAIAEDQQSLCEPGKQIKMAVANELLAKYPRSRKVTLQRVRD